MHCVFSKESLYIFSLFPISTSKISMLSIMMSTCQMFYDFWQNLVISTKEDFHPIPSYIKPLVRHPSQMALYKVTGNIQITICKCNCCICIPFYVPVFVPVQMSEESHIIQIYLKIQRQCPNICNFLLSKLLH